MCPKQNFDTYSNLTSEIRLVTYKWQKSENYVAMWPYGWEDALC